MAFREQSLKDISGLELIQRIPSSAFANPKFPTDVEVKNWALGHIDEDNLMGTILVYKSVDGSSSNYAYAWYLIKTTNNPVDVVRIKDIQSINPADTLNVNNTPLSTEPTTSGNTDNLNEVVISNKGQHWILDINGNAVNMNESGGDYIVTDPTKGFITTDPDTGDKYRLKSKGKGILINEKLI